MKGISPLNMALMMSTARGLPICLASSSTSILRLLSGPGRLWSGRYTDLTWKSLSCSSTPR